MSQWVSDEARRVRWKGELTIDSGGSTLVGWQKGWEVVFVFCGMMDRIDEQKGHDVRPFVVVCGLWDIGGLVGMVTQDECEGKVWRKH